MELLLWLEETRLAGWVRESDSLLAYPTVLFLHTLGLAMVAGLSALLNLRVLGFARNVPFSALTPFITTIWVGFAITVVSGTALLVAEASTKMRIPVLYVKLVFVALALVTLHLLAKQVFRNPLADRAPLPRQAHLLAASSLLFWAGATTAGRLIAYIGPVF
jgi:hypothetical protein